jgi:hypothetical protein
MSRFFRLRLRFLVLALLVPNLYAPTVLHADTSVETVRITTRLDLNSILISGVDIVFFYDDSIAGSEPMTAFSWYSRKRELRETRADAFDIVNTVIPQGFDSAAPTLPARHRDAVRVLVFSEHQNPQSASFDITEMRNVLIEIDQFGLLVSER